MWDGTGTQSTSSFFKRARGGMEGVREGGGEGGKDLGNFPVMEFTLQLVPAFRALAQDYCPRKQK